MQGRLSSQLDQRRRKGTLRTPLPLEELSNHNNSLDFVSNDYLGLARSLRQHKLVQDLYETTSILGATGSRLLSGDSRYARELEVWLAQSVYQQPAALLFNSGYDANLSLLSSILLPGDVVMVDELCHNSIMMGITASRLQTHATFRHNCLTDLERKLRGLHSTSTYSTYNNHCIVIVVESVYSMDGDVAPLTQLLDLAEKYHASVIVDEAHGLGIYGTTNPHDLDLLDSDEENVEETAIEKSPPQSHAGGTGVLAALHLQHHPALLGAVYTFGKAAGCHGAVICGPNVLIQYLWNYARPLVYSTALPRHSLVCIRMAHETLLQADQQRNHLFELVRYLRHLLYKTLPPGIQLHPSPSPIQALLIPGNDACQQVCQHLYRHHHIRLYPIRAPTVPVGQERIRIVLHAYNTRPEVESLCRALRDTFQALGLLPTRAPPTTMVSFRRNKNKDAKEEKKDAKTPKEDKKSAPTKPPTLDDIPDLIETMLNEKGEKSAAATKRIYELCDVGHKQNRVPMVCSGKYDVLTPLAKCLTQESGDGRHLACLALNNLSIPTENKRVMALGPASKDVIGGLCKVIAEDKQESYLCCICLMNLSFLEASITTILQHSPVPEGKAAKAPLDNPESLLRVLEKLLTNSPAVPKSGSGKSEGVRWACGLIKNLAKSEENAALIGQTEIPKCVVENIRATASPPSRWTSNSLEDFSLFVVLNLAQWAGSRDALMKAGAVDVIKPIMAEGDLQGLKATMACAFLDAEWSAFPEGGSPAAKNVSELMTNIVEKKGKDGQYAYGVFKLYTATKAYRELAVAAAKADSGDAESNTKVLATPSSVALCLQIVSDLVLSAMDDAEGGSKYVPDAMSAEYAVGAIHALLPAVLQGGEPARKSLQSEKACGEISNMLLTYSDISGTSDVAKVQAKEAADKISSASGNARPVLEIAHDLWTQYRKREGQPLDQFLSQERGLEVDESGPLDFLPCAKSDSNCIIL